MPMNTKRKTPAMNGEGRARLEAQFRRRVLREGIRIERDVQRLARQLNREMQKSNDAVQHLAIALSSRARALETERDTDVALRG